MGRTCGNRDPWMNTALYEVWNGMMRTARRQWRQSMRDKTGDDFPVDPIFREFYKFRLWACFCHRYRAGESDGWAIVRKNEHEPFSPENCCFSPHPPARDDGEPGITRGASGCAWISEDIPDGEERKRGRKRKTQREQEMRTRLFAIWKDMIRRCENPSRKDYGDFGGRGIMVCQEWHDWHTFRDWAWEHGYCPELSVARIDVDGDYTPDNCRCMTPLEFLQKSRRTHGRFKNVRTTIRAMKDLLTRLPDDAICTLIVQSAIIPESVEQVDFPPTETRIDTVYGYDP